MTHIKICNTCEEEVPHSDYYPRKTVKDGIGNSCKKCVIKKQHLRVKKRKRELFEYKGGECFRCGIVDDPSFYDMHHRDPALKKFRVGMSYSIRKEEVYKEVDKCDMLCPNCHRRAHMRMRDDRNKDKTS